MKNNYLTITIPLVIFGALIAAFGLMIPFLGYYVDDWHHLYYRHSRGLDNFWELFLFDSRPFASIVYYFGFTLLGFKALHWQVVSLLLRGMTVLMVWNLVSEVWPDFRREAAWVALVFGVYPLFSLQPISITYSVHWLGFLFYTISIWAMVRAIRNHHRYWVYTILSIVTSCLHLTIIEYFSGLELIRPFIIWLLVPADGEAKRGRIKKVLKMWLPYLLVYGAFIVFRISLISRSKSVFEHNELGLVLEFIKTPLQTIFYFLESAFKDLIIILGSSWSKIIDPELFGISTPFEVTAVLITFVSAGGLFLYFRYCWFTEEIEEKQVSDWTRTALLIGVLLMILGPIPAWVANLFISTENPLWSNRFGLASMLGASLVFVAILELLIRNKMYQMILFCAIIGLSIGWHIHNSNEYRWSWVKQSNFYQQLFWRAPFIEPKTALLSDGEIFNSMTELSTSYAISTIYPKPDNSMELNYFFFSLYKGFNDLRDEIIQGIPLRYSKLFVNFHGNSHDSLLIYYQPDENRCLWVLRPEDSNNPLLPEISRELAALSNLNRIKRESPNVNQLPDQIYGQEKEHQWCFYYQKADLARQFEDWDDIVELWEAAVANGYRPGNGIEYLPFIEGFARYGDWETAQKLTIRANKVTLKMKPILCAIWQDLEDETAQSESANEFKSQTLEKLNCP